MIFLNDSFYSSLLGVIRGFIVQPLIHPLEVIKIHQQADFPTEKSYQVAKHLFKKDGFKAFYRGLFPQLIKTSAKQAWCWPMITGFPSLLEKYSFQRWQSQALTGLSIATIDAAITTPLERAKILLMIKSNQKFSFRQFYQEGWHGFTTHWMKLSVCWSTFLVAQQYFRDRFDAKSQKVKPTLSQLMMIGVQVACVVSVALAPFDVAHTIMQTKNIPASNLLFGKVIQKVFIGSPIRTFSLVIHNIASVILIDKFNQFQYDKRS